MRSTLRKPSTKVLKPFRNKAEITRQLDHEVALASGAEPAGQDRTGGFCRLFAGVTLTPTSFGALSPPGIHNST